MNSRYSYKIAIIFFTITILLVGPKLYAEDIDAFAPSVKSNAMLTIDTSGSMDWPVYNHDIDYEAFFQWAVENGYASDANSLGEAYDSLPWEKNKIYLTSAYLGFSEITGADGTTTYSVFGDPIYPGGTRRERWISGGIIDTGWVINDWDTMSNSTIETNAAGYVVYPSSISGETAINNDNSITYSPSSLAGDTLVNNQNILLTDVRTDPRTNIAMDHGFLGYLQQAGLYFSGLFETGDWYTLNSDEDAAVTDNGRHRVYAFVTGNFLSFIKLIEDMEDENVCNLSGAGWRNICYQANATPSTTVDVGPIENDEYGSDYSSGLNEEHNFIDLAQFSGIKRLKVYFEYLDIENNSGNDDCSCGDNDSNNDGVYFTNQDGSVLYQNSEELPETDNGKLYGCGKSGWSGWYDVSENDILYVNFFVSLDGGDNCDGLDNGFRITKIKWTNEESSNTTTSESYSCCNGNDGVGQKVFSRIEAVQKAMKTVVEDTSDNITWGLLQWSGDGISGEASLGSTVSTLHSEIDNLYPNGGTPMGEGMQEAYDYSYNYLNNHTDVSECSKNYLIVLTDGFPSGDNSWSRISEDDNDPDFSSSSYHDSDSWGGDPTQGEGDVPNYSDDVARWMYNSTEADFKFTSHTIGFGLENPLLVDIANESNGIHLTAYDQTQLTNAFYSLGLAISEGVSFTAPAISVDEANRAQTGDEIYMSFFKPVSDDYWLGNVKKYRLGWNATGEQILDKNNATATDEDGVFKDTSTSLWSTTNDGGNVAQGGAGQLIKDNVDTYFTSGYSYYRRNIKTWKNNQMVDFSPASVNASELNVSNSSEVSKIVNWVHGYTHAAADNGDPLAVRDWPLGDIIHSEPVIIDYIDNSTSRVLTDRFLAVGSNDGMLHIFDTETGEEKLSFIPPDILDQLQYISNPDEHNYGVDGQLSVYQKGRNPDLLILGERRGGSKYWALNCTDNNPDNWTVAWSIGPTGVFSELGQSWSKMTFSNLTNSSGSNLNRDVGIFTAGYDESEDNFNGTLPSSDTKGRGFFVVDMGTGNSLFRAVHGSVNATTTINGTVTITRSDMKYCFPGSPAVLNLPESHPDGDLVVYASDIAGQILKFLYTSETSMLDKWSVKKIFCSNGPNMMGGAQTSSGSVDKLDGFRDYNQNDKGRKCFNQPEVSYAGDCTTDYPVIYFGTGDRTHPKIDSVKNRFYAFYDMSHNASMIPLDETDLLNLTCDEFDENSPLTGTQQAALKQKLGENYSSQAQGWYINLAEQGNCTYFDSINPDDLNHAGEKVLNPAVLFYKKVYFNTYIPTLNDPCNPKGKSLFYALDYCYGTSGYNYDETNLARTVSDRYFTVEDSTPPSPTRIITRPSKGAIKASSGSRLINEEIDVPEGLQILWWKYNE